jgi:eukaryotic-like serine/threonine-protein kinase
VIKLGTKLGPYEILSVLGAGGMGEVYRAKDARLGRDVAIKVLPAEFSSDPERLRRFELEARSASALSDPHIVTVHDLGEANGVRYLACELVEGSDLRSWLDRGALPVKKVLELAEQIATGLAAAHEKGIVHRDLKPENILIARSGIAKIADFGLAKLTEASGGNVSQLPTSDGHQTTAGVVMGTVSYMSPEQARGAPVDFRSDQFAFGSILYEMLTGQNAFKRSSSPETLASIIRDEPKPVETMNPMVPSPLVWIVDRCLAKDPEERYAATRDLARDLAGLKRHFSGRTSAVTFPAEQAGRIRFTRRRLLRSAGLVGGGIVLGLAGAFWLRPAVRAPEFHYLTYSGHDFEPTVSPDGKMIAFVSNRDGRERIWLKQLPGGREAALTEGPDGLPRFSPDGSTVLFSRLDEGNPTIYRVPVVGGDARKLIDGAVDGDWSPDGTRIAYIRNESSSGIQSSVIQLSRSDGSDSRTIARFNATVGRLRFSPDGRFLIVNPTIQSGSRARFLLVDATTGRVRTLGAPAGNAGVSAVAWSGGREVVYLQAESASGAVAGGAARLISQNIDSGRSRTLLWCPGMASAIAIAGKDRLILDSVSPRQNLREIPLKAGATTSARWLTRGVSGDRQPAYSPDGKRIVFSSNRNGNLDLWEIDTKLGAVRSLTDDAADDWDPAFTPDGKGILWSSNRTGHFEIWAASADGAGARQVTRDGADAENPTETRDGKWIVYNSGNQASPGVWKVRSDGSQAIRLVAGATNTPEVSPDGTLVAYRINYGSPRVLVRVARIDDGAPVPFEIAIENRSHAAAPGRPRWMPDGRALAFTGTDPDGVGGVYVQDFLPGRDTSSSRRALGGFDPDAPSESFGISPDGARLTVAEWENLSSLLMADHVPGLTPVVRSQGK